MRSIGICTVAFALATGFGCATTVGNTLASSTNKFVLPTIMASGDVGVGCASGEALGSMIASFAPYSHKAAKTSIMSQLSAGMCLEDDAWEAELARYRAMYKANGDLAKDAAIREARAHAIAAQRYLTAYNTLVAEYGVPGPDGECPKLKHQGDQLTYMLGLSAGLLAVLHDGGAASRVGVPMDIPADVVRAAKCVSNKDWWGVPDAMATAITVLMPTPSGNASPWDTFAASSDLGRQAHVRLADAYAVQAAASIGDDARLRAAITAHAQAMNTPADPKWKMLDVYGDLIVRHESDKIWTRETGSRTPFGKLGTFPNTPSSAALPSPDDLLGDLLGPAAPTEAEAESAAP